MKRYTVTAVVTAAVLLAAGCSSDSADKKPKADPTAAVLAAARSYQEAQNAEDWRTVCKLRSKALRYGTVETCVEDNTPGTPAPSPTGAQDATPSPSDEPPRYADGSTPRPRATRTTGGPDRADLGPVEASDVVEVPAGTGHPAGYGVLITYTVQWPGKPLTTSARALRLITESGAWVVDQTEDVDANEAHSSAVLTALSGG
ncbi:hypothetical protein [Streptomyces sp. BPSDS2]|uniref:hypothetical protein n=1 Tax=Streptomyces sp. BPSDS2 TaxID=2571021 RepID=UPI0010C15E63|nr:hypothetical protein [Streptomyces sp. BPSDS2]